VLALVDVGSNNGRRWSRGSSLTALSGGVERVSLTVDVDDDVWTSGGHVVDLGNNSLALVVEVLMAAWTLLVKVVVYRAVSTYGVRLAAQQQSRQGRRGRECSSC